VAEFIGRAGETEKLRRRLLGTDERASGAVVTIDGPPGVGKSALAVHVAHQLCEHFPHAQLFADLRGNEGAGLDPTVVLHQFLRALGATREELPSTIEAAARAFRSRLAGRRVLVVLDNAVSEQQVRPLLPGSPTCAVLITSRCPLPGLAEATALTLQLFPTADAVRMLEQVAGPERVGAREAATRVAAQCGHLPLALRIAGARLRTRRAWTVETLAAFMDDERQRLGRLAMGELGVRASFLLSYQQLEHEAARTFRLVSLLGMPEVSVGVAAEVTNRGLSDTEAALEQLVDAALVEPLMPDRYRYHDLLRLYARERAEAEESRATRRAVITVGVDWYLARILEAAVLLGPAHSVDRRTVFPRLADALAWLDTERGNLVGAVVAAGEYDLVEPCWQMADALFRFYELRRYLSDWQQVNQIALHAAERAGLHEVEGRMNNGIGYVYAQQARFDQALTHLQAALAIRREVGDAAGEGRTLKNLGDVRIQLRQPQQALECYEQALAAGLAVGDRHRQGQALHGIGVALAVLGRYPEAEQRLEEALSVRLEVGDEPGEGRTRLWLANVRRDQGWPTEASAEYETSLRILRRVGDRYNEGIALWQLGVAAQQQRDFETAQATWRQALLILEALGCSEAEEVRGLLAADLAGSTTPAARTE